MLRCGGVRGVYRGCTDVTPLQLLARPGYRDYSRVTEVFELIRPAEG